MKRLVLFCAFTAFAHGQLAAQSCTPLASMPDTVLFLPQPYQDDLDGSGIMDTACVGSPFTTVFYLKVPSEWDSPLGTIPVNSIDMATTGGISGLPASLTYVCNPPNCIFKKDSIGCIALSGAPQPGEEGVYDLTFSVVVRSFLDVPFSLPDGTFLSGNYFLHIKSASDAACQPSAAKTPEETGFSVVNRPNPFQGFTEFAIQSQTSGLFRLAIADVLGRPIHQEVVSLSVGENVVPFHAGGLPAGCYFFRLENGRFFSSGRLVVSGQ